jgi:Cu(I)/Ag(I) efflux system protein CusF
MVIKHFVVRLLCLTIFAVSLSGSPAWATDTSAGDDWTQAEIRRVDIANKRMTLKHGEIKSLDMPPMTMVFYVDDVALLQGLKEGDSVRVRVRLEGKRYMVTAVSPL